MMKKILLGLGVAVILAAIFANHLGIDNDSSWGRGRFVILSLGLLLVTLSLFFYFFEQKINLFFLWIHSSIENKFSRSSRLVATTIVASILVLTSYFWFIRLEERTAWAGYEYYVSLAKSFKMGQVYLEATPPPELLAMENPYDYFLRRELGVENFPWDLSFYKNKFYVYWGPVPAILLTILSQSQLETIGDFHLVLIFSFGIYVYFNLLVVTFWQDSLRHAPAWMLGLLILVLGFITPMTIILKDARIYEAAILGCQFFFIGGIFWGYKAMRKAKPSIWMLALASLHWILATGSRIIILPAAIYCIGLSLFYLYKSIGFRHPRSLLLPGIFILIPFAIGGLGQAWYNWTRFDSIFEFGLKYQLANIDYSKFTSLFTLQNIPKNINIYFLLPIKILPKFPFLARIEYLNSNERMAGLLFIAPFIFLSILPLIRSFRDFLPKKSVSPFDSSTSPGEKWLDQAAFGSGVIMITIILSYYFIAMRFIEDFMPALTLASIIQIGKIYDSLYEKKVLRKAFAILIIVFSGITIVTNFLLATPPTGVAFMLNLLNSISKLLGLR